MLRPYVIRRRGGGSDPAPSLFRGVDRDLALVTRERECLFAAARPTDPERRGLASAPQDLHGTILRPVARARLNLPHRTGGFAVAQPQLGPDAGRIPRRPDDANAETRCGAAVFEQPRRR